jgi:hypothetical protein
MERRYHVGRVDGSGPIYRLETRRQAEQKRLEMGATDGRPPEDYYLDGPEDPDPLGEDLRRACLEVVETLHADKGRNSEQWKLLDRLMKLPAVSEIAMINEAFSHLGMTGTKANIVATLYLGIKVGMAEVERARLEKMVL